MKYVQKWKTAEIHILDTFSTPITLDKEGGGGQNQYFHKSLYLHQFYKKMKASDLRKTKHIQVQWHHTLKA